MAPTKQAPVVLQRPERGAPTPEPVRQLRLLTWGLVPPWSADPRAGVRMINARTETVLESRAYSGPARTRRCLVPARGWYEWQVSPLVSDDRGKPRKQPFFIRRPDGGSLALAGLYEFWKPKDADPDDPDAWITSMTLLTTTAPDDTGRIHDRAPLTIAPSDVAAWLDPAVTDPAQVSGLLAPAAPGPLEAYPVGTAVNKVANNGPSLIEPLPADDVLDL